MGSFVVEGGRRPPATLVSPSASCGAACGSRCRCRRQSRRCGAVEGTVEPDGVGHRAVPSASLGLVQIHRQGDVAVPQGVRRVEFFSPWPGVASLDVFGSVARGENGADSDVDLLYVLKPGVRLGFRLFDLEDELTALFGRPVDLVARRSVNKYLREQVLADARPLYAA